MECMVHVYECGCKDLGGDGWLCTVLLGRVASAVMAQDCVRVVDLWLWYPQHDPRFATSCRLIFG